MLSAALIWPRRADGRWCRAPQLPELSVCAAAEPGAAAGMV